MARGDQRDIGIGSVYVWGPSWLWPQVGETERFEMSCHALVKVVDVTVQCLNGYLKTKSYEERPAEHAK